MQPPRLDSPWPWLWALAALALLVAARRGPTARAWWSGTLELWRTVARDPRAVRGARKLPPAALVCAALALTAGGLGLAGARASVDGAARAWTVHVDASPSLYLPWAEPGGPPAADAPSRLAVALERARAALLERGADLAATRWRRRVDEVPEEALGERPPAAWLRAPARPQPAPAWGALDVPGALWLSDDAGGERPARALACLSGGAAVPGPVAAVGRARLSGTPTGLEPAPERASAARVRLGPALAAEPLGDVVAAWATARGLERVAEGEAELTVDLAVGGSTAGAVVARPGRIELPGLASARPSGDPAVFAAEWSERLDRACLPPAGVVAVAERAAAGEPRTLGPGEPPGAGGAPAEDGGPAALSLLAALLGGAALVLGARA